MDIPDVVRRYWTALAARDGKAMAACYHPEAEFRDPVFRLQGSDVGAMWRMLMAGAADLEVSTHPLRGAEGRGDPPWHAWGVWEATYTFTATGRRVHNRIRSSFRVRDGLIVAQRDRFPFWRWSRMALGARGALLGWAPPVRRAVRRRALDRLKAFTAKEQAAPGTPARAKAGGARRRAKPPAPAGRSRTR